MFYIIVFLQILCLFLVGQILNEDLFLDVVKVHAGASLCVADEPDQRSICEFCLTEIFIGVLVLESFSLEDQTLFFGRDLSQAVDACYTR